MRFLVKIEQVSKTEVEVEDTDEVSAMRQAERNIKINKVVVNWKKGEVYAKDVDRLVG